MNPKLLLVDDDEEIRTQMKWALAADYQIFAAGDRPAAVAIWRQEQPAVTLLDLGLPPKPNEPAEGLATLDEILAMEAAAKVIIVSGQGEKQNAIAAVGAGAYDFLCKPVETEELKLILKRCLYLANLEVSYRELQKQKQPETFEDMIGSSPDMQGVFAYIRKVAVTTAPVLLLGESGTGKELAALAIHRRSPRKDGPFIAINCNGIPENLLESELFGHEKGAFTGAHMQRKGLIETAADGTLFLDEIGELPPPIQVKLLRFLQEQRFKRVGGRQEIQIDTRVIAATNADLKKGISEGKFREDLYFRLAVVVINLPPLRERGDDVVVLAREFLKRYAAQNNKRNLAFSPDGMRALYRHGWSGNVR
ncbi:MAG: sigma 54-interacting transcriptional regulator, partial [Chthoniobacterales bacterium]